MKYKNFWIQELHDKYVEAVYQVASIEIRGFTFPKTYEIINDLEKAKEELPQKHINIVLGIKKAYQYVIDIAQSDEPITPRDLQNINKLIDEYESNDKAGIWRKHSVGITSTKYVPPIMTFDEYSSMINKVIKSDYDFFDIVVLCAKLTKLQPFFNGNKRTMICFCNALLAKKDINIIQIHDFTDYVEKLIDYYDDESKLKSFVDFVAIQSRYAKGKKNIKEIIYNYILENNKITTKQIATKLNISEISAKRYVSQLKKENRIKRIGLKGGKWVII